MMQAYRLKRTNANLIVLAAILLLFPLLIGGLGASAMIGKLYKDDPLFSFFLQISIILIIILLVGLAVRLYKKYAPISLVSINTDHLLVVNEKTKESITYPFSEIAYIHVEYGGTNGETGVGILVISNKGKTILSSFYDEQFFGSLKKQLHTIEKLIYTEKMRNGTSKRYFYINPLYLDSAIVKKKVRQGSFYYPLLVLLLIFIVLCIIGAICLYFLNR